MKDTSDSGVSVLGLLGVLFVGLKLCGVIDWSWRAVTLPFWIVPATLVLLAVVVVLIAFVHNIISKE